MTQTKREWDGDHWSHGWSSCHCCETSQQRQLKINHLVKQQAVRVSKQSSDQDRSGSRCTITHAVAERLSKNDSKPNPREWGSVGMKREPGQQNAIAFLVRDYSAISQGWKAATVAPEVRTNQAVDPTVCLLCILMERPRGATGEVRQVRSDNQSQRPKDTEEVCSFYVPSQSIRPAMWWYVVHTDLESSSARSFFVHREWSGWRGFPIFPLLFTDGLALDSTAEQSFFPGAVWHKDAWIWYKNNRFCLLFKKYMTCLFVIFITSEPT